MEQGNVSNINATISSSLARDPSLKYDGRVLWVVCQAALSLMTAVLLYICTCLAWLVKSTHYVSTTAVSQDFKNNKEIDRLPNKVKRSGGNVSVVGKRRRLRILMKYACLFAAISTLLKCLIDQLKFFYAWNARSDVACEIIYDVTDVVLFGFTYLGVYSFLWLKQWLFYCDPVAVKFFYSRRLVTFNRLFVAIILVLSVGVAVANWIPTRYKAFNSTAGSHRELADDPSYLGCVAVYDTTDAAVRWPLISYSVLNATFQVTLMSLFIYPLVWDKMNKWKHSKARSLTKKEALGRLGETVNKGSPKLQKCALVDSKSVDSRREGSTVLGRRHFNESEHSLSKNAARSIRRTIFWTSVCIVTDATLVAAFAVASVGTPQVLITVATDFNLLLNIICILSTYTKWKRIIFPICTQTATRSHSSSV